MAPGSRSPPPRSEALEAAAAHCAEVGSDAIAVPTDIAAESEVERVAARAEEEFGRFDTWVNCAGSFTDEEAQISTGNLLEPHGEGRVSGRWRARRRRELARAAVGAAVDGALGIAGRAERARPDRH